MIQRVLQSTGACFVFISMLAGCGGGSGSSTGSGLQSASLPRPSTAIVSNELCTPDALSGGSFQWINGQCFRSTSALRATDLQSSILGGASAMTTDALMDWAEINFPQYFWPAHQSTGFFTPYEYRYYPGSKNYLGVAEGDVFVLGPLTNNLLTRVGHVEDYTCDASPRNCSAPKAPTIVSATAENGGASIAFTPAPANGGGSATSYDAVCTTQVGSTVVGSAANSPIALSGMSNGEVYTCSVRASNRAGTGSPSASLNVTPRDLQHISISLRSDAGDYIGGGGNYSYTPANAIVSVTTSGGLLSVSVSGDQSWSGSFQLPAGVSRFQVGQYTGLQRYPFHNTTMGGLSWSGEGRGCNILSGSFAVDRVTYAGALLDSIVLRFEQHCEGAQAALRGEILWSASDSTVPPGPVNPPPASLWTPSPGAVPASGNYAYLVSDSGDYIGAGLPYTYTGGQFSTSSTGGAVSVNVAVGSEWWSSTFKAMNNVSQLRRGYYGDLRRYPFHNPAKGGLSWTGIRGCNGLTGWFVVDDIAYTNGALSLLKLRFEQHCEGAVPALRGQVNWTQ